MPPHPREISSPKNPLVQRFRDAARGELPDVLLAEGARLVAEGLAEGAVVVDAAVSPAFIDKEMRQQLATRAQNFVECTDEVLQRLSQLETHQGLAVLFKKPKWEEAELLRGDLAPLVVVAAGVRDPGNLGSLLRTAEAAGATGCLVMAGGADPFRDKAVRGSMGSVFRLPTLHGVDAAAVIAFARRHALQLVVADNSGTVAYQKVGLGRPTLLVLGAEAAGVPPELAKAADVRARIGLKPPVDSLNVAVAAGVLLFEARRQRS